MALLLCQERKDKMQIQEMEENKAQNKKPSDSENIFDWKMVS